jgi:two-component system sensor histidine kinase YesM
MRPESLRNLHSESPQAGGYGLKNVEARIKLRYGPDYGIAIKSVYGGGTAVRILLPAESESEPSGQTETDSLQRGV